MTALEEIKKPLEGRDIATLTNVELFTEVARLLGENDKLRDLTAHLRLQAQMHAMEARGANSTINEIYQIISGGKGEPGNWRGAKPVREYIEAAKGEILRLETELALSKPVYSRRQLEVRAEAAEAEVKRLRNKIAARALTDKQLADEIEAIDEACKGGFGEGGGSPGEWWYERADELEHERKRRELESQLQQHNSRTALASTGGDPLKAFDSLVEGPSFTEIASTGGERSYRTTESSNC